MQGPGSTHADLRASRASAVGQDAHPAVGALRDSPAHQWTQLAELLSRCGRILHEELAQLAAEHGLGESQFSLLWACAQGPPGGLSQNEIAAHLNLSTAHVSCLVEQLRTLGLLDGHRLNTDRRRQIWQLTNRGREHIEAMLTGLALWAEQKELQLSASRREELLELLNELASSPRGECDMIKPQSSNHPAKPSTRPIPRGQSA